MNTFNHGNTSDFEPARPYLERCLLGQKTQDKGNRWVSWAALAAVVSLLAGWGFVEVRAGRRWDAYVDQLRREPGIALMRAEKHGSGGLIAGLKDPKAQDPSSLLADFGLEPSNVRYEWHPYLSLNTPFASERELEADLERIRTQTIRFEIGSARLALAEAGRIESPAN